MFSMGKLAKWHFDCIHRRYTYEHAHAQSYIIHYYNNHFEQAQETNNAKPVCTSRMTVLWPPPANT